MQLHDSSISLLHHLKRMAAWLEDKDVNEIAVNTPGTVWLWKRGVWVPEVAPQIDLDYLEGLGCFVSNHSDSEFIDRQPLISAYLPHGERVEMTRPPACPHGTIYLNIRKHTSHAFSLSQFIEQGYFENTRHAFSFVLSDTERDKLKAHLDPAQLELWDLARARDWKRFLERAVLTHQNILVSGATGTGKTSFIRALIELIPVFERLITAEDTPETPLPNHPNSQALFYKKDGAPTGATAKQVLQSVLRKTPNRVFLAELRGDEAFYYVQNVLNSGHPGGFTTVHANSPNDALLRVALLIKASPEGMGLSMEDIMRMLHSLLHVIVQLVFDPTVGRFVPSIYFDPMYALSLMK